MKTKHTGELQDQRPSRRIALAGSWTVLMILYAYCDILSLYRPGQLAQIGAGRMGFMEVGQASLAAAAAMMIAPTLMIILSLALPARINRAVNAAAAAEAPSPDSLDAGGRR